MDYLVRRARRAATINIRRHAEAEEEKMNLYVSSFLLVLGVVLFVWSTSVQLTYFRARLALQLAGVLAISAGLFSLTTSEYLRYAIGISFIVIVLRSIVSTCQQQLRVTQDLQFGDTPTGVAK
jgi:hypothetical protein